jgi:hypothetical protein
MATRPEPIRERPKHNDHEGRHRCVNCSRVILGGRERMSIADLGHVCADCRPEDTDVD